MAYKLFFVVLWIFSTFNLKGQTIVTLFLNASEYCQGATVRVPFSVSGNFQAGNIFTAQVSDAFGGFQSPINIGSLEGINQDTILATFPLGLPTGAGYRVRVISSAPPVVGIENSVDITIHETPAVTLNAVDTLCLEGLPWDMAGGSPVGGFYTGPGVDGAAFYPGMAGIGIHQVIYTYTTINNCQASAVDTITVIDCATGISSFDISKGIQLFPNPSEGMVFVKSSFPLKFIRVRGALGQMVFYKELKGGKLEFEVSLEMLKPGVYFAELESTGGYYTKKIVIK
jgi:hypothetical protein